MYVFRIIPINRFDSKHSELAYFIAYVKRINTISYLNH